MINKEVIKMQKRTLWVIGFCLGLLALSACTWVGQPAALEEIISSADCTAPCWRGICTAKFCNRVISARWFQCWGSLFHK